MFPRSFFAGTFFAPRFFPQSQGAVPSVVPATGATITARVPATRTITARVPAAQTITVRVP